MGNASIQHIFFKIKLIHFTILFGFIDSNSCFGVPTLHHAAIPHTGRLVAAQTP